MDKLTGLYEKDTFFEKIGPYDGSFAIVDLDNFKSFNDAYGRDVGDEVLIKTAEVLKQSIEPQHFLGRLIHDKFMIFFRNLNTQEAKLLLDDVREHFYGFYFPSVKKELHIIFSAGVGDSFADAEMALQKAKELGRNQIVCIQ